MLGPQLYQIWDGEKTRNFQRLLLRWYARHKRELPWRNDRSPYRIWIAEVMLQQTRVDAALPYYERFLARFPDVCSLASASEDDVIALWAGLGYYSRARNLRLAAIEIVRDFGGRLPPDLDLLVKLPGIGRYTAGALCSIAFNQAQPAVDGNVRRVISRLQGIQERAPEPILRARAAALIPGGRASDFNQALMELGALVCVPDPLCGRCPARRLCAGRANGRASGIGRPRQKTGTVPVELTVLVAENEGTILLTDSGAADFIPGRRHLPARLVAPGGSPADTARILARAAIGCEVQPRRRGVLRHAITYRRITVHVFSCKAGGALPPGPAVQWIPLAQATGLLTSSLYRKALAIGIKS